MARGAVSRLRADAWATFARFPVLLVTALVAAGAGMAAVDDAGADDPLLRIFLVAGLGLPLLFALALFSERRHYPPWVWQIVGLLVLGMFFIAWPGWLGPVQGMRYLQFSLGFHLLAAFLPYLAVTERNGFWQYNRTLFLRFLTASVFSAVLFVGLVIALLAVDNLLGVDIDEENYLRLWLLIAFVFNTWFFLGGIPRDLAPLEQLQDYPKGLKIFSQYILTPIVALYLVILTIYLARILVTRTWPSGWIGYLVSSVAVAGILAFLLVHPIGERTENRWIATFSRGFFVLLFPSIAMLLLAIWQRIGQYGITEKRYVVVVLTLWLTAIAVYYTVRPRGPIKLIPVSLAVIAFLTAAGPWSSYEVSRRSQLGRLETLLERNGLLEEETIQPTSAPVSFADRREISATLRYLLATHDTVGLSGWFGGRLAEIDTVSDRRLRRWVGEQRAAVVMTWLGLEYVNRWETAEQRSFTYRLADEEVVTVVEGSRYHMRNDWTRDQTFVLDGLPHRLSFDARSSTLEIRRGNVRIMAVPLAGFVDAVREYGRSDLSGDRKVPAELMTVRLESAGGTLLLVVRLLAASETDDGVRVTTLNGDLFLTLR